MVTRTLLTGIPGGSLIVGGCQKQDLKLTTQSIQFVDRITCAPVKGAIARPFCGVPGDTKSYRTDQQGIVEFTSLVSIARIQADGYVQTNVYVARTNPMTIVLLNKIP
jgi:hypothetical protein